MNIFARALLLLAVGIGGYLRLKDLDFGFPYFYHPDEVAKSRVIQRMLKGNTLDPDYFLHPNLLIYLTYFLRKLLLVVGFRYEDINAEIIIAGRLVSAITGTLSIALLYGIARRLYSQLTAAGSALFLALFPLHVTCSRYMKEDVLFYFFLLCSLSFAVKAVQTKKLQDVLLASFLGGLSAGSKYTGILSIAFILAIPFLASRSLKPDKRLLKLALCSLLLVPIGFLCCSPYSVINLVKFTKDFTSEKSHMLHGHGGIVITAWSQWWMYHLKRSIFPGVTPPIAVISLFGLALMLWRRRPEDLLIIGFFLLFYLPAEWVRAKPMPQPERYILPCLGPLAIASAELLILISKKFFQNSLRQEFIAVDLILIFSLFPAARTYALTRDLRPDTREIFSEEVLKIVPPGKNVLILGEIKYTPRFPKNLNKVKVVRAESSRGRFTPDYLKNSNWDYLIVTSLSYQRFLSEPNADPELKQLFLDYDVQLPLALLTAARSGTYGFHNPILKLYNLK